MLLPILLGQNTSGAIPYSLTCDAGSYTYTGVASGALKKDSSLTCSAGSYTYTGQASGNLSVARSITAESGSYTYTGVASGNLVKASSLVADVGFYSITGYDATLEYVPGSAKVDYSLDCASGTYAISGQNATAVYGIHLSTTGGSYAITGNDATLKRGYSTSCDAGSYSLTGNDVTLNKAGQITADAGSYDVAGNDASFAFSRNLSVDAGYYAITGWDVDLAFSAGNTAYSLSCQPGSYKVSSGYAEDGYVEEGYWTDSVVLEYKSKAGAGQRKKKRVFIEKDGDLLIFDNPTQAAQYVEAQKEQEKAEVIPITADSKGLQRRKKPKPIPEPKVIKIDAMEGLIRHFHMTNDVSEMIRRSEIDALIALQIKLIEMQDEEDIELLLLAA